ncbi:MAG TPA: hypothetical protein VKU00_12685 [Chthonomonadaceae bacterium]|nr:hypothetical protein [Chthonomonadaceae bacterium]
MRIHRMVSCLLCLLAATPALGAPTGLNTIPTTDLVPMRSWVGQMQNGNTGLLHGPLFYNTPDLIYQSQFALANRVEAGCDLLPGPDLDQRTVALNGKLSFLDEDVVRPNAAFGILNIANHLAPTYYLTFSKTLNYVEQQRVRFQAHHRRNRKLLGRRIHAGLMLTGGGVLEPFVGTDIQLNDSSVFQADWIQGAGNAASFGFVYILPDQKTVVNPAILFSNDTKRFDGFFLNISRQFTLF